MRSVLAVICAAVAVGSLLTMTYYDARLWTRRRPGYGIWDIAMLPRRWSRAVMYTPEGNRYRLLTLRQCGIALASAGLFVLLSSWQPGAELMAGSGIALIVAGTALLGRMQLQLRRSAPTTE